MIRRNRLQELENFSLVSNRQDLYNKTINMNNYERILLKKKLVDILNIKIFNNNCGNNVVNYNNFNSGLIHKNITVIYATKIIKETEKKTEEKSKFNISAKTTFSQLKKNALRCFDLIFSEEYVLTDENYFVINEKDMSIKLNFMS